MNYPSSKTKDMRLEHLYADVDPRITQSLQDFRETNPLKQLVTRGVSWEYLAVGEGEKAILFLHGMAGAYDIWWQQIEALREQARIISVTYPSVNTLDDLRQGILAILAVEEIHQPDLVGSSLGGYLAQYLIARDPDRYGRVVLANTFPPNDPIARRTRGAEFLLRITPDRILGAAIRWHTNNRLFPAAGRSSLLKAYLNEGTYRGLSKADFVARYRCVIEKFDPIKPGDLDIPLLIIEADNDPLLDQTLREHLKKCYPEAQVCTFHNAGHFPYLNIPAQYTQSLANFLLSG